MKLDFKLILILAVISLCLADTINHKFLDKFDELSDMTEEEVQILFNNDAEAYVNSLNGFSFNNCIKELKKLKNVYNTIKSNKGVTEKVFYGAKSLVDSFPGIKSECSIPLPKIDTTKWTIEGFKKLGCTTVVSSFAVTAASCVGGSIFLCPSAVALIKDFSDCVKQLID